MMQMILSRLSRLLERAVASPQEKADADDVTPDVTAPRFSRDESYYWAMHAHW